MDSAENNRLRKVSILNWIGTLILCMVPGINVISLLCFAIFAKAQAKRSFAVAGLILILFIAAAICAAFLIFPDQLSQLASDLRGSLPKSTSGTIVLE